MTPSREAAEAADLTDGVDGLHPTSASAAAPVISGSEQLVTRELHRIQKDSTNKSETRCLERTWM